MISIDRSIIFQIINFVVLVMLLFRFLFKPVVKALDNRSQHIQDELSSIEKAQQEADETKKKYEEESKMIHQKYQEMVETANQEAAKIKSGIIDEAYREGEKIKQTHEEKARSEIQKIFSSLKTDIIDISTEMASKILSHSITPSIQDEIIDKMLDEAIIRIEAQMEVSHEQ
ncbi:MAG: F0F1 ATP synthase subunit B [Atribacterota bacterium]